MGATTEAGEKGGLKLEYLWLYLGLSAAFSGGFMVCAALSRRRVELARRQAQRRIDILKRREFLGLKVPPEAIERHLRS